jgi:hypothetical protein
MTCTITVICTNMRIQVMLMHAMSSLKKTFRRKPGNKRCFCCRGCFRCRDVDVARSKLIDIEESQLWILENGVSKMDYHASDRRKNKMQMYT